LDDIIIVDTTLKEAVEYARAKYDKYFKLIADSLLYYVALALDPRIKTSFTSQLEEPEASAVISSIRQYIRVEYEEPYKNRSILTTPIVPSTIASKRKISSIARLIQKANTTESISTIPATSSIATSKNDVDRYFSTPRIQIDVEDMEAISDANWVMNYWISQEQTSPIMAKVARDILLIVAAEVDVERVFSTGKDIIGVRRQSLNGESIRVLSFLNANSKLS